MLLILKKETHLDEYKLKVNFYFIKITVSSYFFKQNLGILSIHFLK